VEELRQTMEVEERLLGHCILGYVVQSRLTRDGRPPPVREDETEPLPALRPNEVVVLVELLRKHAAAPANDDGSLGHISIALLFSLLSLLSDEEGDHSCFLATGPGNTFRSATESPWEPELDPIRRLLRLAWAVYTQVRCCHPAHPHSFCLPAISRHDRV